MEKIIESNLIIFYDSLWDLIKDVSCDDVKKITEFVIPSIPLNITEILTTFRDEHGPRYLDIVMQVIQEVQKSSFLKRVQTAKKKLERSNNQRARGRRNKKSSRKKRI